MTADTTPISLDQIRSYQAAGQEQADLEESVRGVPRKYVLVAHELYPNGATGEVVTEKDLAHELGVRTGLGDPTDPAGFAIWAVPST